MRFLATLLMLVGFLVPVIGIDSFGTSPADAEVQISITAVSAAEAHTIAKKHCCKHADHDWQLPSEQCPTSCFIIPVRSQLAANITGSQNRLSDDQKHIRSYGFRLKRPPRA